MSNPNDLPNFFDDLTTGIDPAESVRSQEDSQAKTNHLDYLIHQVFFQNEKGKELLEIWGEALIMSPTARPGDDMVQIGIAEGYKSFIRGILLTVKRVNNE